jgi:hypothetical protein
MFDNVQVVQFDAVNRQSVEQGRRIQDVRATFAGKSENQMGADAKVAIFGASYRFDEFRQAVATIHPRQRTIVHRLESEFLATSKFAVPSR